MPMPARSTESAVLVAGGTGFVGGIIASSLVADGRTVIVPSRSAGRSAELLADCSNSPGVPVPLQVSGNHPHLHAAEQLVATEQRPGVVVRATMGGSGAVSVTGAAQHMLTCVMRAETIGSSVRFDELSLMAAVAGDGRNLDPVSEITASQVGRAVSSLICDPQSAVLPALYAMSP